MADATKSMSFAVNLLPSTSQTGSLGGSSNIWYNIYSANSTITGQATFQGTVVFSGTSQAIYGTALPSTGTVGQIFFKLV